MRKSVKKQLVEMLETVEEGIKYAGSKGGNKNQKNNILVDCYSAFSHIKNVLENDLSDNDFVPYKECIVEIQELMEALNENIQNENDYSEIVSTLSDRMSFFKGLIENLDVKLEIVLIPYKSCVWDSLESIWESCERDDACNAIVLVTPYYERNPDGTLGELRYEGDLFPDYVPITDWREYNLKEKRPDVIYFHYPYDDYNLVTAPVINSKYMRECTDNLIYIPYFVLGDSNFAHKK